jgi:hypothetical protein
VSNDIAFQIVCENCGCLSIKIEEPLKAKREAVVRCGDCGFSRGTVGALRDLSVQQYLDIAISAPTAAPLVRGPAASDKRPVTEISRRYGELQRLRQQVEIAEWLAAQSTRPSTIKHPRGRTVRYLGFQPSSRSEVIICADEREQKRPSLAHRHSRRTGGCPSKF